MEKILKTFAVILLFIIGWLTINFGFYPVLNITLFMADNKGYTLSRSDIEILNGIDIPVSVVAFIGKNRTLQKQLEHKFKILQAYNSNIQTEIIRTDLNPELIKKYGVYRLNSILIKTRNDFIFINGTEMNELVEGIKICLNKEFKKIYISENYQEVNLMRERKEFVKFLRKNGYVVEDVKNYSEKERGQVLLIPKLTGDLNKTELDDFLKKGNTVIILFESPEHETYIIAEDHIFHEFNLAVLPGSWKDYEIVVSIPGGSIIFYNPLEVKESRYIFRNINTTELLKQDNKSIAMLSERYYPDTSETGRLIVIGDSEFLGDSPRNLRTWYWLISQFNGEDESLRIPQIQPGILKGSLRNIRKIYIFLFILPLLLFIVKISMRKNIVKVKR